MYPNFPRSFLLLKMVMLVTYLSVIISTLFEDFRDGEFVIVFKENGF